MRYCLYAESEFNFSFPYNESLLLSIRYINRILDTLYFNETFQLKDRRPWRGPALKEEHKTQMRREANFHTQNIQPHLRIESQARIAPAQPQALPPPAQSQESLPPLLIKKRKMSDIATQVFLFRVSHRFQAPEVLRLHLL